MKHEISASSGGAHDVVADRSTEILHQVKPVLVHYGFDGASMQQLARAAGMSAGNFYRYFPSKDAIIAALVERDLQELEDEFAQIRASADPRATFFELVRRRIRDAHCGIGPMLIETEAASVRRPEIALLLQRMGQAIERNLMEFFVGLGAQANDNDASLRAHARLIMLLVKGMIREAGLPRAQQSDSESVTASETFEGLDALLVQTIEATVANAVSGGSPCQGASS